MVADNINHTGAALQMCTGEAGIFPGQALARGSRMGWARKIRTCLASWWSALPRCSRERSFGLRAFCERVPGNAHSRFEPADRESDDPDGNLKSQRTSSRRYGNKRTPQKGACHRKRIGCAHFLFRTGVSHAAGGARSVRSLT
jgi:hypothetical protein